jgi:hypothetical protein
VTAILGSFYFRNYEIFFHILHKKALIKLIIFQRIFDWDKIERLITTTFGNITSQIFSNQDISLFALSNFGIPLTSGMSAGFAVGFMKG